MGPNAVHMTPSMLATAPLAVTFDIAILFARKERGMP
jgi:hypothetical protein